jgi:hypothetical protein
MFIKVFFSAFRAHQGNAPTIVFLGLLNGTLEIVIKFQQRVFQQD